MSSSSEKFTLENVRLFMLEKGGQCSNHDLVSRFKPFLNDPVKKLENRGKLKDFVHLLASVETQEGEKLLVLKKRYQEHGCFNLVPNLEFSPATNPSVAPEGLAIPDAFTSKSEHEVEPVPPPRNVTNKKLFSKDVPDFGFYRSVAQRPAPLEQVQQPAPTYDDKRPAKSAPLPSSSPAPVPSIPPWERSSALPPRDVAPSPAPSSRSEGSELGFYSSIAASRSSISSAGGYSTASGSTLPIDQQAVNERDMTVQEPSQPPPDINAPGDSSNGTNDSESVMATPETNDGSLKKTPLSAKDRIKQFEVSASEQRETKIPSKAKNNRDSRVSNHQRSSSHDSNDTESSSVPLVSTHHDDYIDHHKLLEPHEKQWMLISAECHYPKMHKLLLEHPELAHKRDFINGYNAVHWAAKNGKPDVIKLLNGYSVDVNLRSNSGYTPLHLAAMQSHEECIELLVTLCKAQPSIRDFYGKRAKQYLNRMCSTKIQQMLLNAARQSFSVGLTAPPQSPRMKAEDNFSRTQSFSAKVKKTTQAVARKFSTASRAASTSDYPGGASPMQNRRLASLQSSNDNSGAILVNKPAVRDQPATMSHSQSNDGLYSLYEQQDVQMRRSGSLELTPDDQAL